MESFHIRVTLCAPVCVVQYINRLYLRTLACLANSLQAHSFWKGVQWPTHNCCTNHGWRPRQIETQTCLCLLQQRPVPSIREVPFNLSNREAETARQASKLAPHMACVPEPAVESRYSILLTVSAERCLSGLMAGAAWPAEKSSALSGLV